MNNQFNNPHINQQYNTQQYNTQQYNTQPNIVQLLQQLGQILTTQGPTQQSNQLLGNIVNLLYQNSNYKDPGSISSYIANNLTSLGCNVDAQYIYQMVVPYFSQQPMQQPIQQPMQQTFPQMSIMQRQRGMMENHYNNMPSLGSSTNSSIPLNEQMHNKSRFGSINESIQEDKPVLQETFTLNTNIIKEPDKMITNENSTIYITVKELSDKLTEPAIENIKLLEENVKTDCFEEAVEYIVEKGFSENKITADIVIIDKIFYRINDKEYIKDVLEKIIKGLKKSVPTSVLKDLIEFCKCKYRLNALSYINTILTNTVNDALIVENIYEDKITIDDFCDDGSDLLELLNSTGSGDKKLSSILIDKLTEIIDCIEQLKSETKHNDESFMESVPLKQCFVYLDIFSSKLGFSNVGYEYIVIDTLDSEKYVKYIKELFTNIGLLSKSTTVTLVTLDRYTYTVTINNDGKIFIKK